jgi:lipopolysaccharide biosynthesis glycosyltransferase
MSKENSSIHVVTAADNNFAMPLCVSLFSIVENAMEDTCLHFYILDGGVNDKNKKRLESILRNSNKSSKININWISQDKDAVQAFPLHSGMSRATYLRLFLPDYLPSELERVIYLDCDLVLETDLSDLWEVDLNGRVIGAARDLIVQTISHSTGVKNFEAYGGTTTSPYFNSGVMLINLNRWREENVTKKSIDYLVQTKENITLHEQEALNAALIDQWEEIDPRWNQQGVVFWLSVLPESEFTNKIKSMYIDLIHSPFVIHYVSKSKPWKFNCMHPSTGRFMYYLKRSGWFSRLGWFIWHSQIYRKRLLWLFKDLKKTMKMVSVKGSKQSEIS